MLDRIVENPKLKNLKIVVVGSGYVGLPLAVLKALQGATVAVVDIDKVKISKLQAGEPPFYEEGLPELLAAAIKKKRISFTTDLDSLIADADVIYSCVGTPQAEDGSANLGALKAIAKQIGKNIQEDQDLLVIQTSTVPPGTTMALYNDILASIPKFIENYKLVVSDRPEFLQQGRAFEDNIDYDRKVAALFPHEQWAEDLLMLVEHSKEEAPFIILPDLASAELVKYAANSFLALKISFANEIAEWADAVGADVNSVMAGVGLDSRIASKFFGAGLGWAGGCFPKDTKASEYDMIENGATSIIISATIARNKRMVEMFVEKMEKYFGGNLNGKTIAAAGISFKPTTDFVYPSQSVDVVELLLDRGATVKVYDPVGLENFKKLKVAEHKNIKVSESLDAMIEDADAFALLTEWDEFKNMDLDDVKEKMSGNVIFDGRNAYDPAKVKAAGFEYFGVGRR